MAAGPATLVLGDMSLIKIKMSEATVAENPTFINFSPPAEQHAGTSGVAHSTRSSSQQRGAWNATAALAASRKGPWAKTARLSHTPRSRADLAGGVHRG